MTDLELLDLYDRELAAYLAYVAAQRGDGIGHIKPSVVKLKRAEWKALSDQLVEHVDRLEGVLTTRAIEARKGAKRG
jgi:hypothetical protein